MNTTDERIAAALERIATAWEQQVKNDAEHRLRTDAAVSGFLTLAAAQLHGVAPMPPPPFPFAVPCAVCRKDDCECSGRPV